MVETARNSHTRAEDGRSDSVLNIYRLYAKEAAEKLMKFLSAVLPAKWISVMYFDEAHGLRPHFWVFVDLLMHQLQSTRMWYTFMGTKSNHIHYFPRPRNGESAASLACTSLTEAIASGVMLKRQIARLLTPYIDLGFDHRAIAKSRAPVTIRMGDMETIEFISQYGRPMYADLACKLQLLISLPGGVHFYLKEHRER